MWLFLQYLRLTYTVKPVLRGHLWDNDKMTLQER